LEQATGSFRTNWRPDSNTNPSKLNPRKIPKLNNFPNNDVHDYAHATIILENEKRIRKTRRLAQLKTFPLDQERKKK